MWKERDGAGRRGGAAQTSVRHGGVERGLNAQQDYAEGCNRYDMYEAASQKFAKIWFLMSIFFSFPNFFWP